MDGVRALDIAIETATQVKITDEILKVLPIGRSDALDIIEDLFTAAGFEVIE